MIRLIAAPPDAVLAGGTIDAQKGYPTADDTSEGLAHLTAHQSLSEVPLTIYRVRRDTTWWVIVPDGTTLLTSLPGDIPGLLRRGAPVVWSGVPATVHLVGLQVLCLAWEDGGCASVEDDVEPVDVALDLTDPTGRAHAAWFCGSAVLGGFRITNDEADQLDRARYGEDMTPTEIDTLARLVLRLAGRTA